MYKLIRAKILIVKTTMSPLNCQKTLSIAATSKILLTSSPLSRDKGEKVLPLFIRVARNAYRPNEPPITITKNTSPAVRDYESVL